MNRLLLLSIMVIIETFPSFAQKLSREISNNWEFHQSGTKEWLPAIVPGCIHSDLLRNKKIEDPFYRSNESNLQWIDKVDWEYRTSFIVEPSTLSKQHIELDFKGLDTYADIYLNEVLIMSADNMYREWIIECKKILKPGENKLRVILKSPITEGLRKLSDHGFQYPASNDFSVIGGVGDKRVSVFTRKAPYNYGWDWGPRLVTSGIWRPVYIISWDETRINNIQVVQNNITKSKANLSAVIEVESSISSESSLQLTCIEDKNISVVVNSKIKPGKNNIVVNFTVQDPKLWWTNGLGEPYLYHFSASLNVNKKKTDEIATTYGIRTLRVVEKPDTAGTAFYFELNGNPVFAKGANYIPNDVFLDRVSPEKYEYIVKSAADAHMNMLRVWGGGIYENDIFYNLCDKYGIMLWHDFMFACAMYPGDSAFVDNVRQEAIQNIKRLRNHPCIALWCGNNEMYTGWQNWGWQKLFNEQQQKQVWSDYENLFHKMLPELVNEFDNGRFYWFSSPFGGWKVNADGTRTSKYDATSGDNHIWAVWHGKQPFTYYDEFVPRFASEYGFQSFPDMNTIKTFALPEDYDINSDVMKLHQRSGPGNMLIKTYLDREYKEPKDFASFVYVGQLLQAEGVRKAIEAHRRNMPYCMGSLFWQINDCWQAPSWSSIDYLGHWKALQYYARDVMKEVMVSTLMEKGKFSVYVISDRLQPIKAQLKLRIVDFNGKVLWNRNLPANINTNSSVCLFAQSPNELLKGIDVKSAVFIAEVTTDKELLAQRLFYFAPVKDLQLPEPGLAKSIVKTTNGYTITITNKGLAKNIFMDSPVEGFFDNNYFDLLPGESKQVEFKPSKAGTGFEDNLKIYTVRDTY